jgi:hypothetical protein
LVLLILFGNHSLNGKICSLKRDLEIFSGHPAPAAERPQRQLSERLEARVLPLQRSEEVQGRKKILSAKGTIFRDSKAPHQIHQTDYLVEYSDNDCFDVHLNII